MATYDVGGEQFEIDDAVQGDQLKNTLRSIIRRQQEAASAVTDAEQSLEPKAPGHAVGVTRAALQGATFGFADEAGAVATAALQPAVNTVVGLPYQEGFENRYNQNMQDFKTERETYQDKNPGKALTAEVAGAVGTGVATAGAAAGTQLATKLATLPKWMQLVMGGAAQGGVYGAGAADQGERMDGAATGAAVGAVAAPVIGGAFSVLGKLGKMAAQKISDTPKAEAQRLFKEMAEAEGITADEAIQRMRDLGPEATLADVAENFRDLARYSMDQPGAAKAAGKNLVNMRQAGQHSRLLGAAEQAAGANADDFTQTVAKLGQERAAKAGPKYESAFASKIPLNDQLKNVLRNGEVRRFMKQGARIAEGEDGVVVDLKFRQAIGNDGLTKELPPSNLLQSLHYAKMAMDRRIEKLQAGVKPEKTAIRGLTKMKNQLLEAMDSVSPDYAEARNLYAGDSQLLGAADFGRKLFKLDPEDVEVAVSAMGASEKEMFRLGAMRALRDRLDDVQMNSDAMRQLVGKRSMQKKLEAVFPDQQSLDRFIKQAGTEVVFTQTRNALTGGPNTALRLATGQAMGDAIVPEAAGALAVGDPMRAGLVIAQKFFGKKKPSPETIKELSDTLLQQGLNEQQITRLFRSPHLSQYTGGVLPGSIRGNIGAPIQGAVSNQFSDDD
jgi:hypothetical protein